MFTGQHLKEYAEKNAGIVRVRESVRHPGLFVVKYHNKVFYKNLWTPELCEMRGLVVDKDWNIVVLPFTKVFNRFENGTDIDRDEMVVAARKVNGFMAALTFVPNRGRIISTTGSLDSDFVDMAAAHLPEDRTRGMLSSITYLFEIVDPNDPHIVEEEPGAYLIGARRLHDGRNLSELSLDSIAQAQGFKRPDWFKARFSEVVKMTNECKHEGYMVYGKETALKMKSPYYLTKKLFARIRADKLQSEAFWKNDPKARLEEEYYPLVDHIQNNLETFVELDEQARLRFMGDFLHG